MEEGRLCYHSFHSGLQTILHPVACSRRAAHQVGQTWSKPHLRELLAQGMAEGAAALKQLLAQQQRQQAGLRGEDQGRVGQSQRVESRLVLVPATSGPRKSKWERDRKTGRRWRRTCACGARSCAHSACHASCTWASDWRHNPLIWLSRWPSSAGDVRSVAVMISRCRSSSGTCMAVPACRRKRAHAVGGLGPAQLRAK